MRIGHKASIRGYKKQVWFDKKAITNIISVKNLAEQYRITYDSENGGEFKVHRQEHRQHDMRFVMHPSGLHYYDVKQKNYTFINTVVGNKEGFTKRQIKGAQEARELYAKLGYPSVKDYKWIIQSNQIKDCPITVQNIDDSTKIWGKDVPALKGKTVRKKPTHVAADFVKVPKAILKLHKDVYLTADIFFVNKVPFFIRLSRKICFTSIKHLANRKVGAIFKAFEVVCKFHLNRGFRITVLSVDGEFAPLQSLVADMPGGPKINLASANEHVPEIERRIRVTKERSRATRHGLPFSRIPVLLTIYIVFNSVKMLNQFPTKAGILDTISPQVIMKGEQLDFKKHLNVQLGSYCQVHEEGTPRNNQVARTKAAICLGPSGNAQGGYKFMSLRSGKKIIRRSWDVIPMSDAVIERVNKMGASQPEELVFTDRKGRLIGDVELTGVDGEQEPLQNEFNEALDQEEATLEDYIDLEIDPEPQPPQDAADNIEYKQDANQDQGIKVETVTDDSDEPWTHSNISIGGSVRCKKVSA